MGVVQNTADIQYRATKIQTIGFGLVWSTCIRFGLLVYNYVVLTAHAGRQEVLKSLEDDEDN